MCKDGNPAGIFQPAVYDIFIAFIQHLYPLEKWSKLKNIEGGITKHSLIC